MTMLLDIDTAEHALLDTVRNCLCDRCLHGAEHLVDLVHVL